MTLRTRVHRVLDGLDDAPWARAVRLLLAALILANVLAVVVETVPGVHDAAPAAFQAFEWFSVAVFSAELLLRAWSCVEQPRFAGPAGRFAFWLTPGALIDLLAVLPAYLASAGLDLRTLRLLRLLRILRAAKLGRYSVAARTLQTVLRSKAPDLLALLFLLLVLLVVASTLMYAFEHEAQPQQFSSIPATMWWGIVTLTTIGYGDLTPVTLPGRLLGSVIAVMGIGMFALPAGLLGAAFVEELGKARAGGGAAAPPPPAAGGGGCPHCGRELPAVPPAPGRTAAPEP